ncbi:hypothetical protein M431DRAFT_225692 [Trichoderma harzianum CBS 226.95]|uniref:Uncharacterized protein n=1 Tax=Trichoderma harzianum CBS 226.95 TaxID=983964 RepID=A0A2T4A3T5_TRIHA|nr:hypothetical protein M431DRAFT_225692 [Trichoderma harzianum CBS 226.95]PTB51708.1 hypothetical protein M431DRAFT_225692 [Trichoderma harzianum CBS 226.95]
MPMISLHFLSPLLDASPVHCPSITTTTLARAGCLQPVRPHSLRANPITHFFHNCKKWENKQKEKREKKNPMPVSIYDVIISFSYHPHFRV